MPSASSIISSPLLERLGITVLRPDPVDQVVVVATPHWAAPFGHATACPRDTLLVIGDEIIEAPMAQRARLDTRDGAALGAQRPIPVSGREQLDLAEHPDAR